MAKVTLPNSAQKKAKQADMPAPRELNMPGIRGTIPFMPAEVVLTEYEKKQLKALGWKEGQPVPNISKAVSAERERIMSEPSKIPENVKPAKRPEIVDIKTLPPAKQEEIKATIRSMTESAARSGYNFKQASAIPGLNEAMAVAEKASEYSGSEEITTYDSAVIKPKVKAPSSEAEEKHQHASTLPDRPILEGLTCPRCKWPVNQVDNVEPSREDKLAFVAAILAQARFTKTYNLFGERAYITFRTLAAEETDLVIKQLVCDWSKSKLSGPAHSMQQALFYHMALALAEVSTSGGPVRLEEMSEYTGEPPEGETILPGIVEYVTKVAMPTEPIRKVVAMAYAQFQALTTKLEAMAETPDFWQATGA